MATPKPKMKNIEPDILIINVIAKKNDGTIELSVPDDVFNQAEQILLKSERLYIKNTADAVLIAGKKSLTRICK